MNSRLKTLILFLLLYLALHFVFLAIGADLLWLWISAIVVTFLWSIKVIEFRSLRKKREVKVEGLDDVRMLEIEDKEGSLFIKRFNSDNVSIRATITNEGRRLTMILNPHDDDIEGGAV